MQVGIRWRYRCGSEVLKSSQHPVELGRQECGLWRMAPGTWASPHWGKAGPTGGGKLCSETVTGNWEVLSSGPKLDHLLSVSLLGAGHESMLLGPLSLHLTAYIYVYVCFILSTKILIFMSVSIFDTTAGRLFFLISVGLREFILYFCMYFSLSRTFLVLKLKMRWN